MRNIITSLIFGGAGFIGTHLCRRLLGEGRKVICVDDLSTGRKENIEHLCANESFQFIEHDVALPLMLPGSVDEIYNLACPASPAHYQRDPVKTFRTSVLGAMNVLDLAREKQARVLQASTSEVYGDPTVAVQDESYWGNVNPNGLRSCYDEGKRAAETLFCDYHRQYGVETRIVRIFNTYGPGMQADDGRVVSNFIVQALRGEPITVNGDGSQTRSFMFVSDLIEGLVRTMNSDAAAMPINLGNPHEVSVEHLVMEALRVTGSHSKIVYHPLPSDDPKRRCPNISRATTLLDGWMPKVSLDDGLAKTVRYFEQQLKKQQPFKTKYHETKQI